MPDNMIEVKKDGLSQRQSGDWKATFTLQALDMPDYLLSAPMGKRFYVVFVDADNYDERENISLPQEKEQTEGEKLRTRAVMLCKDEQFQEYCNNSPWFMKDIAWKDLSDEDRARQIILRSCYISSRSEIATNELAQDFFKELLEKYKDWQAEQSYADNLERY